MTMHADDRHHAKKNGSDEPGTPNAIQPGHVVNQSQFQHLQALDDAIAYRTARVAASCPNCEAGIPGYRCDDHARDIALIAEYERRSRSLFQATEQFRASRLRRFGLHSGIHGDRPPVADVADVLTGRAASDGY